MVILRKEIKKIGNSFGIYIKKALIDEGILEKDVKYIITIEREAKEHKTLLETRRNNNKIQAVTAFQ